LEVVFFLAPPSMIPSNLSSPAMGTRHRDAFPRCFCRPWYIPGFFLPFPISVFWWLLQQDHSSLRVCWVLLQPKRPVHPTSRTLSQVQSYQPVLPFPISFTDNRFLEESQIFSRALVAANGQNSYPRAAGNINPLCSSQALFFFSFKKCESQFPARFS